MKLSAPQLAALRLALDGDGRLYRWPGGAWCGERAPTEAEVAARLYPGDRPHTTIHTIRGLESRGLLAREDAEPLNEWRATRALTDAGRAAITTKEPPK